MIPWQEKQHWETGKTDDLFPLRQNKKFRGRCGQSGQGPKGGREVVEGPGEPARPCFLAGMAGPARLEAQ